MSLLYISRGGWGSQHQSGGTCIQKPMWRHLRPPQECRFGTLFRKTSGAMDLGGLGSGRTGGNPTVDVSPTITVPLLFKGHRLQPGLYASGGMQWQWAYTGEPTFSTHYEAWLDQWGGAAKFNHDTYRHGRSTYLVSLVARPQPFGGLRWWFICPRSGRRVAKLHMPLGAYQFAARKAYRLPYNSQRGTVEDRLRSRAMKLRRRLGDADGEAGDELYKPKWMRWRTFDRRAEHLFALEEAADAMFVQVAARFLRRFGSV
jgi:hypothetical protein